MSSKSASTKAATYAICAENPSLCRVSKLTRRTSHSPPSASAIFRSHEAPKPPGHCDGSQQCRKSRAPAFTVPAVSPSTPSLPAPPPPASVLPVTTTVPASHQPARASTARPPGHTPPSTQAEQLDPWIMTTAPAFMPPPPPPPPPPSAAGVGVG
eukprot:scaffold26379_cov58-Phaeocystis_antarctica.AAC.3